MEFTVNEMLAMQTALQEKYKDIWEGVSPQVGQNKLLWMVGEIGEVIDVIKKNGWEAATQDPEHRKALVEELADVLMYYNDIARQAYSPWPCPCSWSAPPSCWSPPP